MTHERGQDVHHRNYRHHNHHFSDHAERWGRGQSSLRDSQESTNTQNSNSCSLPGFLNEQQRNSGQYWAYQNIRSHFPYPPPLPYPSNAPAESSSTFPFSHYNVSHQRLHLGHQRQGPYPPVQGNTWNTRYQANLTDVRRQENPSSSEAQDHSGLRPQKDPGRVQQKVPRQSGNKTGVSMTSLPFFEVVGSVLEVLVHPTGKFSM